MYELNDILFFIMSINNSFLFQEVPPGLLAPNFATESTNSLCLTMSPKMDSM